MKIISEKNKAKIDKRVRKHLDKLGDYKMTQCEKDYLQELVRIDEASALCTIEARNRAEKYGKINEANGYDYDFDKEARELLGYNEDEDGDMYEPLSITNKYEANNGSIAYSGVKILLSGGGPSSWIDTTDGCYHYSNGFCHGKYELPREFISALDRYCYREADMFQTEKVLV